MAKKISPEHMSVIDSNGTKRFGELYFLTAAQMGANLRALLEVSPEATFTPEDLAGYHAVQYGVSTHYPETVLEFPYTTPPYENENVNYLYEVLPRVLGEVTVGAIAERIVIGEANKLYPAEVDATVKDYFDLRTEPNHIGTSVNVLYPRTEDGLELEYRDRSTLVEVADGPGDIRNRVREVYVDFLTVGVPGEGNDMGVVLASDIGSSACGVKSITLV